jgi:hypothetical protein
MNPPPNPNPCTCFSQARLEHDLSAIKGCGTPLKASFKQQDGKAVFHETFATTFYEQFSVLLSRAWVNTRRSPVHTHAASGRSITMGAIVGLLFYAVGSNQRSVQDRTGALYFVLTSQIFSAQASFQPSHDRRDCGIALP